MQEKDVLEALQLLPGGSLEARRVLEAARSVEEADLDAFCAASEGLSKYYCGLVEQGTAEAIRTVIREVQDSMEFREEAERALRDKLTSSAHLPALIRALQEARNWNARSAFSRTLVENYGRRAVRPLAKTLRSQRNTFEVRCRASDALGQIGGRDAVDVMIETAADETEERRLRAAVLSDMGSTHDSACLPLLTESLRHRNVDMRAGAVFGLGRLGCSKAAPDLMGLLEDPVVGVRLAAASALVRLGHLDKLERLTTALLSQNANARYAAIVCLTDLDVNRFSAVLEPLLDDPHPKVRAAARRYVEDVRRREREIAECDPRLDDPTMGDFMAEMLGRLRNAGPRLDGDVA